MKPPSEYLAEIGRRGGKAKGAGKRRGGPEYYRELVQKRWAKRRKEDPRST